tara:strand:+ start:5950 stop:6540 length:591 start_codon:yes stop_codon:yes gene_type:complete
MKTKKLTIQRLNELIEEVMMEKEAELRNQNSSDIHESLSRRKENPPGSLDENIIHQPITGMGLASSSPSIQDKTPSPQLPKQKKKKWEREELQVVKNLEDIPFSFAGDIEKPILLELDPLKPSEEQAYKEAVDKARRKFQSHYRSLTPGIRYGFEKWLRKALLQNLSLDEAQEIVARFSSASKGQSQPKNPMKKPS